MATADAELLADYAVLRAGVGSFVRPRDVLSVSGPDAAAYLQGQCSQDLDGLGIGHAVDSLLLEPDGKLTALVRVTMIDAERFVIDVAAGFGESVATRLLRFKLRSKLEIEQLDWPCIALRGSEVADREVSGAGTLVLPFAWNGVVGVDLLGPGAEASVPADAHRCGDDAAEALRIEAGIPAMGRELDGRTIAAEAHLVERTVSFTKGCYTGQELVARLDARGNRVARRLCGVVVGDESGVGPHDLEGLVLTVPDEGKPVGTVTSSAWCPGLGGPGGLAYVHRSVEVPGEVRAVGLGPAEEKAIPVEVRPLPLVTG